MRKERNGESEEAFRIAGLASAAPGRVRSTTNATDAIAPKGRTNPPGRPTRAIRTPRPKSESRRHFIRAPSLAAPHDSWPQPFGLANKAFVARSCPRTVGESLFLPWFIREEEGWLDLNGLESSQSSVTRRAACPQILRKWVFSPD